MNQKIALKDVLLCGFALFSLKDSSLLEYIHQYKTRQSNLKTVYSTQKCPSDTAMRQILDEVEPSQLQELSSRYIQLLDEDGYLLPFELKGEYLSNHLLIPLDGIQYYCSKKVNCPCFLTKEHRDGTITYHHNALSGVIVHPDLSEALVIATEDIQKIFRYMMVKLKMTRNYKRLFD